MAVATKKRSARQTQDWPTYRGDIYRAGVSADTPTLPLLPRWTHQARHAPAPAWPPPAVDDLFHRIRGLSPTLTFDRAFHPVLSKGKLYYASSSDDAVALFTRISLLTGNLYRERRVNSPLPRR